MDKQTKGMLKKILSIDSIIILFASIISTITIKEYASVMIIGLFMSIINFNFNAVFTYYTFVKTEKGIHNVLGAAIRVFITIIVAILLYNHDEYNLFAFLAGYTLHYLAIIIYGFTIKNEKGSD